MPANRFLERDFLAVVERPSAGRQRLVAVSAAGSFNLALLADGAVGGGPVIAGQITIWVTIPPGPAGSSLMVQSIVFTGGVRNGIFSTRDAHEIRFLSITRRPT